METAEKSLAELVTIIALTTLGSEYVFPDVALAGDMKKQAEEMMRGSNLSYSNISGACLVIPTRIIQTVHADHPLRRGLEQVEELWRRTG